MAAHRAGRVITVRNLLDLLCAADSSRALAARHRALREAAGGGAEWGTKAGYHAFHEGCANASAISARSRAMALPGAERLRLLAEAAGARMDAGWLRQAVARVALAEGMEADDVMALPLHGFAELVEAQAVASASARRARRRRGRGRVEDRARDLALLRDWRAARAAGVRTIAEFARARGLELDDVRSALDRARKPPRRGASQRPRRRAGK